MESFAPKTPEQGISWAKALVHSNYTLTGTTLPHRELLTESQRLSLQTPASDERGRVRHYTLSSEDLAGVTSSTGWPSWVGRNPALWCPEREVGKAPPLAPQLNHATAPCLAIDIFVFLLYFHYRASSSAGKRLACQVGEAVYRAAGSRVAVPPCAETTGQDTLITSLAPGDGAGLRQTIHFGLPLP